MAVQNTRCVNDEKSKLVVKIVQKVRFAIFDILYKQEDKEKKQEALPLFLTYVSSTPSMHFFKVPKRNG